MMPFHQFAGIVGSETLAGSPLPIVPDGIVTFDGAEAEATTTGVQFDFSVILDGDAVPLAV